MNHYPIWLEAVRLLSLMVEHPGKEVLYHAVTQERANAVFAEVQRLARELVERRQHDDNDDPHAEAGGRAATDGVGVHHARHG